MASRKIKHKDNAICVVCRKPVYTSSRYEGIDFHYTKKRGQDPVYVHARCLKTQGDVKAEEGATNEK